MLQSENIEKGQATTQTTSKVRRTASEFLIAIVPITIQLLTKSPIPQVRPYKYTIPLATIQSTTVPVSTPDLHHSTGYEPINLSEPLCTRPDIYAAVGYPKRKREGRRSVHASNGRDVSVILPSSRGSHIHNDKAHITNGK